MTNRIDFDVRFDRAISAWHSAGVAFAEVKTEEAARLIRRAFPTARRAVIDVWPADGKMAFNVWLHLVLGPDDEVLWHCESTEFEDGEHECQTDGCTRDLLDPTPVQDAIAAAELALFVLDGERHLPACDDAPGNFPIGDDDNFECARELHLAHALGECFQTDELIDALTGHGQYAEVDEGDEGQGVINLGTLLETGQHRLVAGPVHINDDNWLWYPGELKIMAPDGWTCRAAEPWTPPADMQPEAIAQEIADRLRAMTSSGRHQ
ncbi:MULTISPECIES: hypothetical protein [Asanoa]|uniref:Uncharacterized protein n=1 Tax=Asanoa hainanensis TaxID=560556 RepID=A0A239PF78_9ACTN|nr:MULTISPECIES: hypothetical protein [Asanoa]SNT65672.1 hypothetical protein SAMN05421812_12515 [Asanoa hainanensis]